MQTWEDTCRSAGARLVSGGVICQEAPDEEALEKCRALAPLWHKHNHPRGPFWGPEMGFHPESGGFLWAEKPPDGKTT